MHDEVLASDTESAAPAATEAPQVIPEQPFQFRGSAREYFRIWIVNLALGIVTLGIYSAWASVRTRRYFYAHTWLAGSPFEYSARPLPILRGRLIAALAFGCYVLAAHTSPWLQLAAGGLIAALMPWLIVRGLAFRARYSSWRGLPFRFEPDYAGAYKWFLAAYLMMLPTLGLIYPLIKQRQQRWTVSHHRYGSSGFEFDANVDKYYTVFFATMGIAVLAFIAIAIVMGVLFTVGGAKAAWLDPKLHPLASVFVIYALYLPCYLVIFAYSRSRMLNLLYNGTQLAGGHRLHSTLGFRAMAWIYVSNLAAIVCTLGLAAAWAKVRMVRYRAAHLVLQPAGDLDAFVAETTAQTDVGALGAEMDGFFSIDIGL